MSRTLTYTVPPEWDGRTVKDFARQHLGLSSRAFVKQKYLPGGLVKNGQPCRRSSKSFTKREKNWNSKHKEL